MYSVEEDDDNGNGNVVEVCVEVFGELDRDVAVTLSTSSQTAIGTKVIYSTSTCLSLMMVHNFSYSWCRLP